MRRFVKIIPKRILAAGISAAMLFQALPVYALSEGEVAEELSGDYNEAEPDMLSDGEITSDGTGEQVTTTYGDDGLVDFFSGETNDSDGKVKVTYYEDNNKVATGIQTIYLDPYTLYDVVGDGENVDVNSGFIRDKILNGTISGDESSMTLAQYWGAVASRIFKSADEYGSFDGTSGFDKQFGKDHNNYNCFFNLADMMGSIDSKTYGSTRSDYSHSTGWTSFDGGLIKTRESMAREVARSYEREEDWDSQVLRAPLNEKDSALPEMKGTTENGIYNVVVSLNKKSNSAVGYVYNAFGIALYDFDLVPIVDANVDYVTAAQKYKNEENPLEKASNDNAEGVVYLKDQPTGDAQVNRHENKSTSELSGTDTYTEKKTTTTSNTVSNTSNYTFSQSLKYSPKMEISMLKLFSMSAGTELNISSSELFGKTVTEQKTITQETSLTNTKPYSLPPHTEETITFQPVKTTMELEYKLPVALTYKVAIFGTNGYFTSGSKADSYYYIAGYRHAYFSTFFGDNDDASFSSAQADLYDRTVANKPGYYKKHDRTSGCKHTMWGKTYNLSEIDWKTIAQDDSKIISDDLSMTFKDARTKLASCLPMSSSGANMKTTVTGIQTIMSEIQPLYKPEVIKLVKGNLSYTREVDGVLDMYELEVAAYENHDTIAVPYAKFDPSLGYWQFVDKDGTPITDSSIVEMQRDVQGDHAVFHKEGTYFLAYRLSDDAKYDGTAEPGVCATNNTIETVFVKVNVVKDVNELVDAGNIEINTGCQVVADDEPVELEHLLEPVLTDINDDTELNVEFTWEVQEQEGVKLLDSGTADFHEPGLYHFKASAAGYESAWAEVEAVEARRLTTIRFEIPENSSPEAEEELVAPDSLDVGDPDIEDETEDMLIDDTEGQEYSDTLNVTVGQDHQVRAYPLSYLHCYDQYGEEWTYQLPDIQLALPENSAGAYLNGDELYITQPGSYAVAAFAEGFEIAPMFVIAADGTETETDTDALLGGDDTLSDSGNTADDETLLTDSEEDEESVSEEDIEDGTLDDEDLI